MVKLFKTDGTELGVVETPRFIKISAEGSLIEATEDEAVGVAFEGNPYNLSGHDTIEGADEVVLVPTTLAEVLHERNEAQRRLQASVDYMAMMTNVDLDVAGSETTTNEEGDE